ncbi:MAG: PH domain-containing protein [Burkholderiales bacterium]|nr:PH domain-containing protein [Burkholderiales bacterium]
MIFRSKIDTWLSCVLVIAAAIALWAAAATVRQGSGTGLPVSIVVVLIGAVLPMWILLGTVYSIESGTLRIRSGPFSWRIPVASITSVEPSRSPVSSPALSLERLRVEYGAGKSILVSPADRQAFIAAIEHAKRAM